MQQQVAAAGLPGCRAASLRSAAKARPWGAARPRRPRAGPRWWCGWRRRPAATTPPGWWRRTQPRGSRGTAGTRRGRPRPIRPPLGRAGSPCDPPLPGRGPLPPRRQAGVRGRAEQVGLGCGHAGILHPPARAAPSVRPRRVAAAADATSARPMRQITHLRPSCRHAPGDGLGLP